MIRSCVLGVIWLALSNVPWGLWSGGCRIPIAHLLGQSMTMLYWLFYLFNLSVLEESSALGQQASEPGASCQPFGWALITADFFVLLYSSPHHHLSPVCGNCGLLLIKHTSIIPAVKKCSHVKLAQFFCWSLWQLYKFCLLVASSYSSMHWEDGLLPTKCFLSVSNFFTPGVGREGGSSLWLLIPWLLHFLSCRSRDGNAWRWHSAKRLLDEWNSPGGESEVYSKREPQDRWHWSDHGGLGVTFKCNDAISI